MCALQDRVSVTNTVCSAHVLHRLQQSMADRHVELSMLNSIAAKVGLLVRLSPPPPPPPPESACSSANRADFSRWPACEHRQPVTEGTAQTHGDGPGRAG